MVNRYISELPAELNTLDMKIKFTAEMIEQHRLHHNNNMFVMEGEKLRPKTASEAELFFQNKFVRKSKVLHGALNHLLSLQPNSGYLWDTSQGFGGWRKDRPELTNDFGLVESDLSRVDYIGDAVAVIKDPKENYTLYTQVGGRYTVAANLIQFINMPRDESNYIYFNKGAGFFSGDFTHYVDVKSTGGDNDGIISFWAMSNTIGDVHTIRLSADILLAYVLKQVAGTNTGIVESDGGTQYSDATAQIINENTWYYHKPDRDEGIGAFGTLFDFIYTDSNRNSLLDTLSIALHTIKKYRNMYAASSFNIGDAPRLSGDIANLDLQPIAPATNPYYYNNLTLAARGRN